MMIKRISAIAMSIVCVLSLVACGSKKDKATVEPGVPVVSYVEECDYIYNVAPLSNQEYVEADIAEWSRDKYMGGDAKVTSYKKTTSDDHGILDDGKEAPLMKTSIDENGRTVFYATKDSIAFTDEVKDIAVSIATKIAYAAINNSKATNEDVSYLTVGISLDDLKELIKEITGTYDTEAVYVAPLEVLWSHEQDIAVTVGIIYNADGKTNECLLGCRITVDSTGKYICDEVIEGLPYKEVFSDGHAISDYETYRLGMKSFRDYNPIAAKALYEKANKMRNMDLHRIYFDYYNYDFMIYGARVY